MKPVTPQPDWNQYCNDSVVAGAFENRVLYAMCRDNPSHDNPYIVAGKITAIGRIYAAAPERGAGVGRSGTLADAIAQKLSVSHLDTMLKGIEFSSQFSNATFEQVVKTHALLIGTIDTVIREWSLLATDPTWKPRKQGSFASKYLHFHRPNAFPIMDKFAKAGLACSGRRGVLDEYSDFCRAVLGYVDSQEGWTLRSIDTGLVARGRIHADRTPDSCPSCGKQFARR